MIDKVKNIWKLHSDQLVTRGQLFWVITALVILDII